jgi:putative endonuclease
MTHATDKPWFLYMIECEDGSIYTGIATDVASRFLVHAAGKGAKYTRSHKPRELRLAVRYPNRSIASKAEYEFKRLTAQQKHYWIAVGVEMAEAQENPL